MFTPYPYQQEALDATLASIQTGIKKGVIVLPTGAGKTVVAALLAELLITKLEVKHITWITHRDELKTQAYTSFKEHGLNVTLWDSKVKDATGDITVVMIGSAKKYADTLEVLGKTDTVVFIDEAHHAAASTYQFLIEQLDPEIKVGFTATPTRLDNRFLDFDKVFYQKTFLEIVDLGFLAQPLYIRINTFIKAELSRSGNDYSKVELAKQLNIEARNKIIAANYFENKDKYGKCIAFAIDVEHAEALAEIFEPYAKTFVVHSKLSKKKRAELVSEFKATKGPCVFINVEIAIEGFDCKDIDTVLLCRPTCSEVFFCQMVGRGARRNPLIENPKDDFFYAVDFVDGSEHYARLSDKWSIEHLGRQITPEEAEAIAVEEERQGVISKLKDAGVENITPKIESELMDIVGVLKVLDAKGRLKRFVITKSELVHLNAFIADIKANKNNINDLKSYLSRYFHSRKLYKVFLGEYNFNTIGWALYLHYVKGSKTHQNGKKRIDWLDIRSFTPPVAKSITGGTTPHTS